MKKILITGTSRGLGYELLRTYHSNNFKVFPVVRSEKDLERIQKEFPINCYPILADLTNDEAIDKIKEGIKAQSDDLDLDIVINNAGISGSEYLIETVKTEEVSRLFNIHCLGPIRTVQACLPFLKNSTNAVIINVSSRLGSMTKMSSGEFKDRNFSYSYRMAKAAQNMFTVSLSQELEKENITVVAIHPGKLLTRGRSSDADTDPAEAAKKIYKWSCGLDISNSGTFVQPLVGELAW